MKRLVPLGAGSLDRFLKRRKLLGELREAVCTQQSLRGRCAGALRHEPIPAPHHSVASDKALANGERLSLVNIAHGDLFEAPRERFGRADMIGEAGRSRWQWRVARLQGASGPPTGTVALADCGIRIFAEGRSERAFIAGLGGKARDRRAAAVFQRSGERIMLRSCRGLRRPCGREPGFCLVPPFCCRRTAFVGLDAPRFGFARGTSGSGGSLLGDLARFDLFAPVADGGELLRESKALLLGPG